MVTLTELQHHVEVAFATTARGVAPWPAPHPDRAPLDEEYSRLLDPGKWRIVPARAEAWCAAAVELGLATLDRDVAVRWAVPRPRGHVRIDRLVPHAPAAVALVLAYSSFGGADLNGLTVAAGDPAVELAVVPQCGCDACDSGSEDAIDLVDEHVRSVIAGHLRHLTDGERTIQVTDPGGWSASGRFRRGEVDRILTHPDGWREVAGPTWLGG